MRRFYNTDQRSLMGLWCSYKLNGIYYDCQIIHVPTEVENVFKIRPVYAIEDIGKGQGMDIELTEEEFKDKSIVRKPFILEVKNKFISKINNHGKNKSES